MHKYRGPVRIVSTAYQNTTIIQPLVCPVGGGDEFRAITQYLLYPCGIKDLLKVYE